MSQRNPILVSLPLLLALGACEEKDKEVPTESDERQAEMDQPPASRESNIEKVAESPEDQYGKTMTLQGEVDKVLSDRAFQLEEKNALWGDSVLVLLKEAPTQPLREGVEAKVTGKVEKLVVTEIEAEVGWDLDQEIETEYNEKPIVVADTLTQLVPAD